MSLTSVRIPMAMLVMVLEPCHVMFNFTHTALQDSSRNGAPSLSSTGDILRRPPVPITSLA